VHNGGMQFVMLRRGESLHLDAVAAPGAGEGMR